MDTTTTTVELAKTSTCVETLTLLASNKDWEVRENVAGNASTPGRALRKIAVNEDGDYAWLILRSVASNRNATSKTLKMLADHGDHEVRACVAGNTSTPAETLTMLAKWSGGEIPEILYLNPSTPVAVKATLRA